MSKYLYSSFSSTYRIHIQTFWSPPFKCLNIYKYEFGFAEIFVSNFFTEESLTVQNY